MFASLVDLFHDMRTPSVTQDRLPGTKNGEKPKKIIIKEPEPKPSSAERLSTLSMQKSAQELAGAVVSAVAFLVSPASWLEIFNACKVGNVKEIMLSGSFMKTKLLSLLVGFTRLLYPKYGLSLAWACMSLASRPAAISAFALDRLMTPTFGPSIASTVATVSSCAILGSAIEQKPARAIIAGSVFASLGISSCFLISTISKLAKGCLCLVKDNPKVAMLTSTVAILSLSSFGIWHHLKNKAA